MSTVVDRLRRQPQEDSRTPLGFGLLLLLLAAALLINSAIGPLGTGLVDYPIT